MDGPPFLLGGSAWLNLVNTRFRHNKEVHDVLDDPESALQWLHINQLIRGSGTLLGSNTDDVLREACAELKSFREICEEILADLEKDNELSASVLMKLNEQTESLSIRTTAVLSEGKLTLAYEGISDIDHMLYLIIRSIADTFDVYSPDRIRKCEHEECILHFVDTSKSGKRRWCRMEVCGNRHKAAEFYAKKKKTNTPNL
ncbi:CGNR zinc finger domain-containing protein [Paenibacillus sp. GCM10027628]|uniref:CGNR zinc finger domain-containing protein n=1 Tax=Paenibacillus sp. GCM10027628 TaxID=3273413 RepID=UPI00362854E9